MTLLIQAANLEYAYGGNDVLTGATFEIRQGDRLALIGATGRGRAPLPAHGRTAPAAARDTHPGAQARYPCWLPQPGARFRSRSDGARGYRSATGDPTALEARARELEQMMGEAAATRS